MQKYFEHYIIYIYISKCIYYNKLSFIPSIMIYGRILILNNSLKLESAKSSDTKLVETCLMVDIYISGLYLLLILYYFSILLKFISVHYKNTRTNSLF